MMTESSGKPGKDLDFELNLASIIDCFVVLITYLLVSASFISLGVFDVNVPTLVAFDERPAGDAVDVHIDLDSRKNIHIKVSGAAREAMTLPSKNQTWDTDALQEYLRSLKSKWPEMTGVVLSAEKSVVYREMIRMIDTIRKVVPGVALGDQEQT